MYVRGGVRRAGRQTSRPDPAGNRARLDHTAVVAVRPARTVDVDTAAARMTAGSDRRKETTARSRNPSPFGLTVVNRGRSRANGVDPLDTRRASRRGASLRAWPTGVSTRPAARTSTPRTRPL